MLTLKIAARWIALVYAVVIPLVLISTFAPQWMNPLEHPKVLAGIILYTLLLVVIGFRVEMGREARSLCSFMRELAPTARWEALHRSEPAQFGRTKSYTKAPPGRVVEWRLPGEPSRPAVMYLQTASYSTQRLRGTDTEGEAYRHHREARARLEVVIEAETKHTLPRLLIASIKVDGEDWAEWLRFGDWHVYGSKAVEEPSSAELGVLLRWTRETSALMNHLEEGSRNGLMALPTLFAQLIFGSMLPSVEPTLELAPHVVRLRLPAILFETGEARRKNHAKLKRRLNSMSELCGKLESESKA
jgi:hypothetical protein